MSVWGDTVLIGAPAHRNSSGAAYVFARTGTSFMEVQKLLPVTVAPVHKFGEAVSLFGDTAMVGAPQDGSGAVYFYRRVAETWVEQQTLRPSDPAASTYFGWSVWISENAALIGAPSFNEGSAAVYAFAWDGSNWVEQSKLTSAPGPLGFGHFISGEGDTAFLSGGSASGASAVRVYTRSATGWAEVQVLEASDGGSGFGASTALVGDRALIGASSALVDGVSTGAAYLFTRSGNTWSEQQKFAPADGYTGGRFGASVALFEDEVLIGSPNWYRPGKAYAFSAEALTWTSDALTIPSERYFIGRGVAGAGSIGLVALSRPDYGAVYALHRGKAKGEVCGDGEECASTHCFDGRCCDAACDGACAACSIEAGSVADGYCDVMPAGSLGVPACGTLTCDGLEMDCVPCLADASCPFGKYCAADGMCQPRRAADAVCNSAAGADCAVAGCRVCMTTLCTNGSCSVAKLPAESGGGCRVGPPKADGQRDIGLVALAALVALRRRLRRGKSERGDRCRFDA
jgi:hypothetical protein